MERRIVIVGAGIAGLAVAYEIRERAARLATPVEVLVLERAGRTGGNIRSERDDGFLCEWGANGYLDNAPATADLVARLGLADRLLPSNEASARRYLFRAGQLRELPTGLGAFLGSDVLTWRGKLRVLTEPFRGADAASEGEESVFEFAARRLGPEAATILVDAMVSGVHAGDATRLSLRSTFPKMAAMEAEHGSLTRAMLARRKASRGKRGGGPAGPGGKLTSFIDGVQELTGRLERELGASVRLNAPVATLSERSGNGFTVETPQGSPLHAGAVVLACPAWSAAEVVRAIDTEMADALAAIPSAPIIVVHLGFDAGDLGAPLDGFGFLVPRDQGPRILGALWTSSIFEHRAPARRALVTCMIGGARDPEAIALSDEQLVDAVRGDLRSTMALSAKPVFVRVLRHARGIPQYTLGHAARLATIERRLGAHPGLAVCGNSYRGISINACIEEAARVAATALDALS